MKHILSLAVILILTSCSEIKNNEITEETNINAFPTWVRTDPNTDFLNNDTIGIDTNYVNIIFNSQDVALIILMVNDSIDQEEKQDIIYSYNLYAYDHFIDDINVGNFDSSWSTSSNRTAHYYFYPRKQLLTRIGLNRMDTLGINHYLLDSIYFEVVNLPQKVTTRTERKIISIKEYDWKLTKNCIGKKHGTWKHWNVNGELLEEVIWEEGKMISKSQGETNKLSPKLRFLYSSNGGLIGYYNDGSIRGGPKCDLLKPNLETMSIQDPIGTYSYEDSCIIEYGKDTLCIEMNASHPYWAMVDYKWYMAVN